MNTEESLQFIADNGKFGIKLGLEVIAALLARLGDPQKDLTFIHVAGTNGKGSVSTMLSAILTQAGYTTGLYTSPALERFNERIRLNTQPIPDRDLARYTSVVKAACDAMTAEGLPHPTGFEIETAIALLYFKESRARFCILEVGMGGRLDATNVIPAPLLAIIMRIDIDHADYLGDTIAKIAAEKAAIIKAGSTVIAYPQLPEARQVITEAAAAAGAPLIDVDPGQIQVLAHSEAGQRLRYTGGDLDGLEDFTLSLLGEHQSLNCLTALKAAAALRQAGAVIPISAITKALETLRFSGRFEILHREPVVLIDGAHNPNGIEAFARNLRLYFPDRPIHLYFGMLADKDIDRSLSLLLPLADQMDTLTPDSDRAMDAEAMAERVRRIFDGPVRSWTRVEDAVASLDLAQKKTVNAFAGSLYLIGRVRTAYFKLFSD
jgi:dihydrofolate synthase/folylpolyglutamate synthase